MAKSKSQNNIVNKALTPDEMALLEDLSATIEQFKSLQGGGDIGQEGEETTAPEENENEEIEMAENIITDEENPEIENEDEDEGDNEFIKKELKAIKGMLQRGQCASKSDEEDEDEEIEKSEDARASADERIDPNTLVNDETMPVKKALDALISVTKSMRPGKVKSNDLTSQIRKAMMPLIQAITPIAKTVTEQGKAIHNILDDLGYAKAIENTVKVEKSKDKQKPVQTVDTSAIATVFAEMLQAVQKNNNSGQQIGKTINEDDNRMVMRQNLQEVMHRMLNSK